MNRNKIWRYLLTSCTGHEICKKKLIEAKKLFFLFSHCLVPLISLLHKLFYCFAGRFQIEVTIDLFCTCDKHVPVIRLTIGALQKVPGKITGVTVVLRVVVLFLVFTHVMRRPRWCTKQWQNVAQVLQNYRIKFPRRFSLLFCTPTWPP